MEQNSELEQNILGVAREKSFAAPFYYFACLYSEKKLQYNLESLMKEVPKLEKKVNKVANLGRIIWLYTKYQMISKGVLALIIFPLSSLALKMLIESSGRTNLSSGDYLSFLFSTHGAGMLLLGMMLLIFLIGTDINAFIIMSALIREDRIKMTAKQLLVVGIRSLRSFLKPAGLLIMLYVAIVVPLVGVGITIKPMENFEIPNFVKDVIFKNSLYRNLYYLLILFLSVVSTAHIFLFHYVLLMGQSVEQGLKSARSLMKKHWKSFLVEFFLKIFAVLMLLIVALIAVVIVFGLLQSEVPESLIDSRAWTILGMMYVSEIIAFSALMFVPMIANQLTKLFYRYNEMDGTPVCLKLEVKADVLGEEAFGKVRLRTKIAFALLFLLLTAFNIGVAALGANFFDELFRTHKPIEIVAHRGGGDLAAENSIASIKAAKDAGAKWSEIDVQRTMDGLYIINHDSTFARVTGDNRAPSEMTLGEVRQLRIEDLFDTSRPSQKVPTLEEVLDYAKGNMGLYIELKGRTADIQMADDVIAMVKEREMLSEVAILSLDYSLIQYIEQNYPEVETGFLYFFCDRRYFELGGRYFDHGRARSDAKQNPKNSSSRKKRRSSGRSIPKNPSILLSNPMWMESLLTMC